MTRPGTIALSRRAGYRGIMSGEGEFEAALGRLDELIDRESRQVLATVGEQRMRRILHAQGWTVLTAPDHGYNTGGPDAVAWRSGPGGLSVLILDNKATTRTRGRTVLDATGLQAPSLVRHIPAFIGIMSRARSPLHRAVRDVLERTLDAARLATALARQQGRDPANARIALPSGVRLMVTNACGPNLTGVSPALTELGIGFHDVERAAQGLTRLVPPLVPCPPTPQPQRRAARLVRRR